jgi:hypothetical protein
VPWLSSHLPPLPVHPSASALFSLRSFAVNTLAPGSFTVHPPSPDSLFCPRLFAPFASARPRLFSRLSRPIRSAAEAPDANSNRCSSPSPFNPPVLLLLL